MTGESTDEDVLFYHDSIFEKGYTSGLNSVDITSDNQTAIDTYIANNNIYSEEQYLEYGQLNYETGFADAGGIINDNNVSDSNDDVLGDDDSFESIDYIVLITLFILFLGVLVFIIKAIINAKKNSSKNKYYSSKKRKARR